MSNMLLNSHRYVMLCILSLLTGCRHPGSHDGREPSTGKEPLASFVRDEHGAIIRGDLMESKMAIVFTGDSFADGGTVIRKTLQEHDIRASFFLTGNFYANSMFRQLIVDLKNDGHYLGAHSDKHLLYADWTRRDSLLVSEAEFRDDLLANYERMAGFGIHASDTRWFIPPYEWYNAAITRWTEALGFHLINFSPGTLSAADYTYPEMGNRYVSSDEIFRSILHHEQKDPHGLNGFMLLIHIGTDPRRTDKFYNKLDSLVTLLKEKDYALVTVDELLDDTRPNQQPTNDSRH